MDAETAAQRIKAQPPQEEKVARADVVIDTDGLMRESEAQFALAWDRLPDPATVTPKMIAMPQPAAMLSTPTLTKVKSEEAAHGAAAVAKQTKSRPETLQVRRARPSDIPSILLLMQKVTEGAVKIKRAELLMALSERSYFIGQIGVEVSAVMGWSIDSQVARIDQIFIHPPAAAAETGTAILEEIEASANSHICEIIVAFLNRDVSPEIRQILDAEGYVAMAMEALPRVWQNALKESQPEDAASFVIKVLREDRLSK
jgi:dephospho-CoA kinase